jgi:HD-GYP domain-containing protein (c-di-GMP phosphodiesterase class II)
LQQKRIKIDTANIAQGMYVAQLDCSWLTTPFMKRGFEVSSDDELGLLRKFCKHVYVDVTRSSVSEQMIMSAHHDSGKICDPFSRSQIRKSEPKTADGKGRFHAFFQRFSSGKKAADSENGERTSMRVEAPLAMDAYVAVNATMDEMLQRVKKRKPLDIDKLHQSIAPMVASVRRNPDALAWLGLLRKSEQGNFSFTITTAITTAIWALIMGNGMGLTDRRLANLAIGALLLDIGNIRIPKSIGLKDGPLTEDELQTIRKHVNYGLEIVKQSPGISDEIVDMIRYHHERLDGSGYPEGCGSEIPAYGRIAGVIDSYDAMITKQPYADQKCAYAAVLELNKQSGIKFQQEVVEQFIRAIGMFPTGSLVELNTGEVAVVVEQNVERRLRPKILVLLNAEQQPVRRNKTVDLSKLPDQAGQKKALWIKGGFPTGSFNIDPEDYFLQPKGNA